MGARIWSRPGSVRRTIGRRRRYESGTRPKRTLESAVALHRVRGEAGRVAHTPNRLLLRLHPRRPVHTAGL